MYAGPPKNAQELFFWSYHLRVSSSNWRKYFVVGAHWYIQPYTSVQWTVFSVKFLVCSVQFAVINLQFTLCNVYWVCCVHNSEPYPQFGIRLRISVSEEAKMVSAFWSCQNKGGKYKTRIVRVGLQSSTL